MNEVERPPLTIDLAGKTVKMTYGLEMDIRRMLPDASTSMQLVLNDPFTQDYIIRRVLTDKKAMVMSTDELIPQEDVDLEPDEVEKLIAWVVDHSLYFFVTRSSNLRNVGDRYKILLQKPSTTGSENSPSETPSAGPSA